MYVFVYIRTFYTHGIVAVRNFILILMFNLQMVDVDGEDWLRDYPVTLVQFLLFLYHNQSDFIQLSVQPDFIAALAATLFPFFSPDSEDCVTTPEEEFKVQDLAGCCG